MQKYFLLSIILFAAICVEAKKYGLSDDRTVVETFPREENKDMDWWVNSGAYFNVFEKIGSTVQGNLPETDRFFGLYNKNNPVDTDGGMHPQNIFRLVTNQTWTDYTQTVHFKINKINLSESPNRNQSNGVLLFLRYGSGDFLYYAGIRVDGNAVIKKKNGGLSEYSTMALKPFFDGNYNHDFPKSANLIPTNAWIAIRAEIKTNEDKSVSIKLWIDKDASGAWQLATEATDDGSQNGAPFLSAGYGGIRTDFMDVEFHSYKVKDLSAPPEEIK